MGPENEERDVPDWGVALQSAIDRRREGAEEDDEPQLDVVSSAGLPAGGAAQADSEELPYVVLLKAAVSMVKTGELSMDEYVEGVKKLDVIADNALKVYAIPAVKNDLPAKLTDHQNSIVDALEVEIHRMKEGLALLLDYPQTRALGDLETGMQTAVSAMNAMADIQKKADTEYARIMQQEQEDKARRAQQAAQAESESDS
ncbi:MAG: hypothetical protein HY319_24190 [Armatimonadetes bacterium]|nr:hypothetical protein [Armatimonadota bacterium]